MSLVYSLTKPFSDALTSGDVVENFHTYKSLYEFSSVQFDLLLSDEDESFWAAIKCLVSREVKFNLRFSSLSLDPFFITSSNISSFDDKKLGLKDYLEETVEFEEKLTLEINLDKDPGGPNIDIFDCSVFFDYLNNLELNEFLKYINVPFSSYHRLSFSVWEKFESFSTGSIHFHSVYPVLDKCQCGTIFKYDYRADLIEKRSKAGHFSNSAQFEFFPEDFIVCNGVCHEGLKDIFNACLNVFLLVYLSDLSSISASGLFYKLKGYKQISEDLSFEQLKIEPSKELIDVYQWTYLEGNYTDKIGLSRNVLSIHLTSNSLLSVEAGTSDSVRSGYDLYLKDNVKQYVEIKNKISDFIHSQSDKATEITKNMFSMFKTSLWTFTTFFVSVFLLRALNKSAEKIVTDEVLYVAVLLVFLSFGYLMMSVFEVNSDRKRLISRYSDIERRYKDLIDKKDLNRIINVSELTKKESRFINKKRNVYIVSWVLANLLLLTFIFFLHKGDFYNFIKEYFAVVSNYLGVIVNFFKK